MAKILHIHPNFYMAKKFVFPLIEFEKSLGYDSSLVFSAGPPGFYGKKIEYDFSGNNIIPWIKSLLLLFVFIRRTKPDIVFCHNSKASFFPLIICWLLNVRRRIYFNHGVPFLAYNYLTKFLMKTIELTNLRCCTNAITISEQSKSMLDKIQKRIFVDVIANGSACGIDLQEIENVRSDISLSWRIKNGYTRDDFIIAYIGRAEVRKGFKKVLEIWKTFEFDAQIKLILCGPNKEDVTKIYNKKLANMNILGFVDDIFLILNEVDVVILPSFHEGMPYVLLEAMAFGRTVICNNTYGINSIVRDGYNGYLIENNDINNFYQKIIYAYENRYRMNEIADNARSYVKSFDRNDFLKSYRDYLNNLK
ncbi:MAG: glycosyltransferase [Beijerinckiaceae bacterium]|nr:glycosyltransferase [Beijerinckiaceae bacterium]